MARSFRGVLNESADKELTIFEEFPNCVTIHYTPKEELIRQSNQELEKFELEIESERSYKLLTINGQDDFVEIFPINTLPGHADFLKNKYDQIESITLEGFGYETPSTVDEILEIFRNFPSGFIKDYEYGLGLLKDYRFIVDTVEQVEKVKCLVISTCRDSFIENDMYCLSFSDFELIRKGINRISEDNQSKSRKEKVIFTFNSMLHNLNPDSYPEKKKEYKKDVIYKTLITTTFGDAKFSKNDSTAILDILHTNKDVIYKNKREKSIRLKNEIELLDLKWIIDKFEQFFSKSSSENDWQKLFTDNPFALSLVFGYPIVKIQGQASVGGRMLSGSGEKITDFLVKNILTNNTALIEIKKPGTLLLRSSTYRDGVYPASNDLTGSITQILDQKYKFQKEISTIKDNSGIYDIESYAIDCVLIIGKMPTEKDKIKSFEMFRYNSKDVRICTFDEMLHKLKNIYSLLQDDN